MSRRPLPWGRLLAEGAVIVAGVLIALTADRWMQDRDDRELEREYLVQLLDDFETADSTLTWAIAFAEARLEYAELVLAAAEGQVPDSIGALDVARAIDLTAWLFSPPMPRDTWSELVADGKLTLLTNRSLRREIALFYRTVDVQEGFHREWTQYMLPYRMAASSVLPPQLVLAIAQQEIDGQAIDPELVPARDSLVAAVRALRPGGEPLRLNWAAAWQYKALLDEARRIADALREELE